jgi:hypothetical protein
MCGASLPLQFTILLEVGVVEAFLHRIPLLRIVLEHMVEEIQTLVISLRRLLRYVRKQLLEVNLASLRNSLDKLTDVVGDVWIVVKVLWTGSAHDRNYR